MAQERDTWAGLRQEGALFSGSLFKSLQKRNDLPNVGNQFPGLMSFIYTEENKRLPLGGIYFLRSHGQPAAVGTWPDTPGGTCHYLHCPQELSDMVMVSVGLSRGWKVHCGPGLLTEVGERWKLMTQLLPPPHSVQCFFFV